MESDENFRERIQIAPKSFSVAGPRGSYEYFIDRKRATQASEIQEAVEAAIHDWITWQRLKLGRDINPSELNHRMLAAGAKRTEILSPSFRVLQASELAVISSSSIIYGGLYCPQNS